MSYWRKYSIRFVNKRGWGCSDGDVDPFVLLGIWNNKIDSIVGVPSIVIKIENGRVGEVKPQWVLAKCPPLESVALFWSVFVFLQTNVKLSFFVYFWLENVFLFSRSAILTVQLDGLDLPRKDWLQHSIILVTTCCDIRSTECCGHKGARSVVSKNTLSLVRLITSLKSLASICAYCANPIVSVRRRRENTGVGWSCVKYNVVTLAWL